MANLRFAPLIWFCTLPYTALHTMCLLKTNCTLFLILWNDGSTIFAYMIVPGIVHVFFLLDLSGLQGALGALILPSGLHHISHKSSPSPRANMSEVQLLPRTLNLNSSFSSPTTTNAVEAQNLQIFQMAAAFCKIFIFHKQWILAFGGKD